MLDHSRLSDDHVFVHACRSPGAAIWALTAMGLEAGIRDNAPIGAETNGVSMLCSVDGHLFLFDFRRQVTVRSVRRWVRAVAKAGPAWCLGASGWRGDGLHLLSRTYGSPERAIAAFQRAADEVPGYTTIRLSRAGRTITLVERFAFTEEGDLTFARDRGSLAS